MRLPARFLLLLLAASLVGAGTPAAAQPTRPGNDTLSAWLARAQAALRAGDREGCREGAELLTRVARAREAVGDLRGAGTAWLMRGQCLSLRGERRPAVVAFRAGYDRYASVGGDAGIRVLAGTAVAREYRALRQVDSAAVWYGRALQAAREADDRKEEAAAAYHYADALDDAGQDARASDAYRTAVLLYRARADRKMEGLLQFNRGLVFRRRAQPDSALAAFRASLALRAATRDAAGTGRAWRALGSLHDDLGRRDSAVVAFRNAVLAARRAGNRAEEAAAANSLALVHQHLGAIDSARANYRVALDAGRVGDPEVVRMALINYGNLLILLAEADSALAAHRQALALAREASDRTLQASAHTALGGTYEALGRPDSALIHYREALVLQNDLRDTNGMGHTAARVAGVQINLGMYEEALQLYAYTLRTELQDGRRADAGQTLGNMAVAHDRAGRPDSALVYYRRALEIAVAERDLAAQAYLANNLAGTHLEAGRPDSARAGFRHALAMARRLGDRGLESRALTNLGIAGRRAGTEAGHREAVAYLDSAAAVVGAAAQRTSSDAVRVSFREQEAPLYDLWPLAWLARTDLPAEESAAAALAASERGRARSLLELMQRDASSPPAGADLVAEGRALLDDARRGGAAVLYYTTTADTLLVWLAPAGGPPRVHRVAVGADSLAALVTAARKEIGADEADAERALRGDPPVPRDSVAPAPRPDEEEKWTSPVDKLARILLPPGLLAAVPAGTELVLLPRGPLASVPFAALPTTSGGEPLGARHPVRYAPSLATLAQAGRRPPAPREALRGALVVGNPTMPSMVTPSGMRRVLAPLKGAEREARWVAARMGIPPVTGADAGEIALRDRLATAPLVHLATHGFAYADVDRARESFVALAPGDGADGRLTVAEVLEDVPPMKADLVVLSACQTGLGSTRWAEGTVGLQRAFLARGARSVLVSLWSVSDVATELLMQRFYEHWLSDADRPSRAEALRRAQEDVRKTPGFGLPVFWAGFQLVGAG